MEIPLKILGEVEETNTGTEGKVERDVFRERTEL